jgi:hypothetical protein
LKEKKKTKRSFRLGGSGTRRRGSERRRVGVDARAFARPILARRAGRTLSALKNFFSSQAVHFVSLGFLSPAG